MDYRIAYVIYAIKTKGKEFSQIKAIQATAKAIATDMKELIRSTRTTVDKSESPDKQK